MSITKEVAARIDEIFVQCSSDVSTGLVDFRSVAKVFWPVLDNKISIIDLAGIFSMTTPNSADALDSIIFSEFFNGVARVKYPTGADFCERLLDHFKLAKGFKIRHDLPIFAKAMDKQVIREFLKFDIPLRRAFGSFAGQTITIGGGLTWNEVKKHSIAMEVGGFSSFAGAYSLIPSCLTLQKCETFAREILSRFPLLGTANTLNTALLYPQFQLLLCAVAMERNDILNYKDMSGKFAMKTGSSSESRTSLADMLGDLIRAIGIDKNVGNLADTRMLLPSENSVKFDGDGGDGNHMGHNVVGQSLVGVVNMPTSTRPEDTYSSSMNHSRHAQLLRMDHLFEEIETKMLEQLGPGSEIVAMLASTTLEEKLETRARLSSKPVVIGDAVPVPTVCPEPVEQLLQAALAHHNLGSFEESLKFMEAARMQIEDIERRAALQRKRAAEAASLASMRLPPATVSAEGAEQPAPAPLEPAVETSLEPQIPLDLELYITLCKGNVYQSCGDDEQSLLHYLDGWSAATAKDDKDWEIVCLNSIGMLAYYSLRYDVALLCFAAVAQYRAEAYGLTSADTATAWNNEGCCFYCLNRKGDARLRFERSWAVMCKILGHRAPRAIAVWKNLEKARRLGALGKAQSADISSLRPDADRLIIGGSFQINAMGPPVENKKKKGGKKGGKKK